MNETQTKVEFEGIPYKDNTIKSSQGKFRYVTTGNKEGSILIFIHGSPGDWSGWKDYLKDNVLQKKFHMIALDRPGYGSSSNLKPVGELKKQSELIDSIIQALQLDKTMKSKKIILIGHSYGSSVAMKYVMLNPKKVSAMVLIASPADPKLEGWYWYNKLADTRLIQFFLPQPWNVSNFELKFLKKELELIQQDWKKINIPILVIHGQDDFLVPVANAHFIKKQFLNKNKIKIISRKKDGHFIIWQEKKFIQNKILQFLKKQKLVK